MSSTDTRSIRKCVLIHISIWLLLSIAHTLCTEPLIALLFPGFQSAPVFLFIWVGGLIVISGATLFALAVSVIRMLKERKRNKRANAGAT